MGESIEDALDRINRAITYRCSIVYDDGSTAQIHFKEDQFIILPDTDLRSKKYFQNESEINQYLEKMNVKIIP